jgi:hypothetical protein
MIVALQTNRQLNSENKCDAFDRETQSETPALCKLVVGKRARNSIYSKIEDTLGVRGETPKLGA